MSRGTYSCPTVEPQQTPLAALAANYASLARYLLETALAGDAASGRQLAAALAALPSLKSALAAEIGGAAGEAEPYLERFGELVNEAACADWTGGGHRPLLLALEDRTRQCLVAARARARTAP